MRRTGPPSPIISIELPIRTLRCPLPQPPDALNVCSASNTLRQDIDDARLRHPEIRRDRAEALAPRGRRDCS
jgi:hypothetical protein